MWFFQTGRKVICVFGVFAASKNYLTGLFSSMQLYNPNWSLGQSRENTVDLEEGIPFIMPVVSY
jgi:hypothetical protein